MAKQILRAKHPTTGRFETIHGHAKRNSPEYRSWHAMKDRCLNKNHIHYGQYGGKGIRICSRWLKSFEKFLEDMGPRPSLKHSLDRFPDRNGDYEPSNCRWATAIEQRNNSAQNRFVVLQGKTASLTEHARRVGICPYRVSQRLSAGWTVEDAFLMPIQMAFSHPAPGSHRGRPTNR